MFHTTILKKSWMSSKELLFMWIIFINILKLRSWENVVIKPFKSDSKPIIYWHKYAFMKTVFQPSCFLVRSTIYNFFNDWLNKFSYILMSASIQSGNASCRDLSLDVLTSHCWVDPTSFNNLSSGLNTYPNLRATYCGISCMHFKMKFIHVK